MKKFLLKLLLFIPFLFIVAFINVTIDPASIFSKGDYEYEAAELLFHGAIEHTKDNYNERLMKKYYIYNMNDKREVIVMGSSRAMEINSTHVNSQSFFNVSVSGATIPDIIGLTQVLFEENKLPNRLIIGVDPWIFNKNNNEDRWENGLFVEYNNFYGSYEENKNISLAQNYKIKAIISPIYFQDSIKELLSRIRYSGLKSQHACLVEKYPTDNLVQKIDGSIIYPISMHRMSQDEVEKAANEFISTDHIYQLDNFTEINSDLKQEFEHYLNFLKKNGVEYNFFLAPYHPTVYDYFKKTEKYASVIKVEEYIRNIAAKEGISVYGSYNPSSMGFENKDFYDGMHLREEAIEKVFDFSIK